MYVVHEPDFEWANIRGIWSWRRHATNTVPRAKRSRFARRTPIWSSQVLQYVAGIHRELWLLWPDR